MDAKQTQYVEVNLDRLGIGHPDLPSVREQIDDAIEKLGEAMKDRLNTGKGAVSFKLTYKRSDDETRIAVTIKSEVSLALPKPRPRATSAAVGPTGELEMVNPLAQPNLPLQDAAARRAEKIAAESAASESGGEAVPPPTPITSRLSPRRA